jgi:2-polyprenyl-3-methyl-5-hydroxy-6-metoxy-1,4-benzoquinol methylase
MASIRDDRGYNQGFKPTGALEIRMARRCNYVISQIRKNEAVKILEIGCGTGQFADYLAGNINGSVLATDLCVPFITEAKNKYQRNNLRYEALDFNNKDFSAEKFDYIVGDGIMHHLYYNLDKSLEKMKKLLKKDGKIIFLEPNFLNPYCYLIFNFAYFRKLANLEPAEKAFSRKFIKAKLFAAGFTDIRIEYKDFLLPCTPEIMIRPVIKLGSVLEKTFPFYLVAQSIFISANIK